MEFERVMLRAAMQAADRIRQRFAKVRSMRSAWSRTCRTRIAPFSPCLTPHRPNGTWRTPHGFSRASHCRNLSLNTAPSAFANVKKAAKYYKVELHETDWRQLSGSARSAPRSSRLAARRLGRCAPRLGYPYQRRGPIPRSSHRNSRTHKGNDEENVDMTPPSGRLPTGVGDDDE
jgi:hypothetical protein